MLNHQTYSPRLEQKSGLFKVAVTAFFCLFIFNQFYSIYFRFHNHKGPIGLDDADFYISCISYFKDHNPFTKSKLFDLPDEFSSCFYNFHGLTSAFLLGKTASFLNISAEKIFHYNFYIGIFLMGLVLYIFLKQTDPSPLNIAVGMTIFSFYTGNGCYHGFFWVTPSFYCALLWLSAIWIFFYSKRWKIYAPVLILMLFFSHSSSIYAITIICLSIFFDLIFDNKIWLVVKELFKKRNVLQKIIKLKEVEPILKIIIIMLLSASYYAIYNLLSLKGVIVPAFLKKEMGSNLYIPLSTFDGFYQLWTKTPFPVYAFGWLLPLLVWSIFCCIRDGKLKLLSLFTATFSGTIAMCLFYRAGGRRTFLFMEIIMLLIITYGLKESILYLWNNRDKIFQLKQLSSLKKLLFLTNGAMAILGGALVLYLCYQRVEIDFCMKFRNQRYWNKEAMQAFMRKKGNSAKIFYFGSADSAGSLLSLDGWWDKSIYPAPSTVDGPKWNVDFSKKPVFFGEIKKISKKSKKIYMSRPDGFGVFLPSGGRIVLDTGTLSPGNSRITLSDTGVPPEQFLSHIKLQIQKNGTFEDVPAAFLKQALDINIPETYPAFMPPWYSLAAKYIRKKEPDYLTVRESFQYSAEFSLAEPADRIYIKNYGTEELNLIGAIDILSLSSGQSSCKSFYSLDLYWEEAQSIQSKAGFLFRNKDYPLLWKDPNPYVCAYINSLPNNPISTIFVLEENFGDIKAFYPFKEKLFTIQK